MKNFRSFTVILTTLAIILATLLVSACATSSCGYMKYYNKDRAMGMAH